MKFSLVCAILTIALLANQSESFLFRPWGLGLGLRRWGFGLGGLGWGLGGLGWGGVPLAVPVPVPVAAPVAGAAVLPAAGFGGLVLGKRDTSSGYGYDNTKPDDSSKMVESESQIEGPEKNDHDHKGHSVEDVEHNVEHNEEKVFPVQPVNQLENNTAEEFFSGNETEGFNSTDFGVVKRAIVFPAVPLPVPVRAAVVAPIVPVARLGLVAPIVRVAPVAFVGKRSIVNASDIAENSTVCRLSTQNSTISCRGVNFNFECDVVANVTEFGGVENKNEDFRVLPNGVESFNFTDSSDAEVRRFEIVSLKDDASDVNDYTFVHDGQKVVLSLYWSERNQETGFRFREQQCWNTYVDMLRVTGTRNVRLVLDVARV